MEVTTADKIYSTVYGQIASVWTTVQLYDSVAINYNKWYHEVLVWDKPTAYLYINGIKKDTESADMATLNNSTILTIGRDAANDRFYFNGLIDEVRIYNLALSQSQIEQNYIAGANSLLIKGLISKEEYVQRVINLSQNQ